VLILALRAVFTAQCLPLGDVPAAAVLLLLLLLSLPPCTGPLHVCDRLLLLLQ
jgi:hypothetical protein